VTRRDIPNLISGLRLLLVPGLVALLLQERYSVAFYVFLLAGLSDAADGFLARTFDWRSELGAILDPLADKLMVISVTLTLAVQELIPLWLAGLVVARDLLIVSGFVAYRLMIGQPRIAPSCISRLNTALLIAMILAVIAIQGFSLSFGLLPLFVLVALTTIASGGDYAYRWLRRARGELARD